MTLSAASRGNPSTARLDAVIEEARRRARRRRVSYAAVALAAGGLAAGLFLSFRPGGGGPPRGSGRPVAAGEGSANANLAPGSARFLPTVRLPRGSAPTPVQRAFARRRYSSAPPREAGRLRGPTILWASPAYGGGWCEGLQQPRHGFYRLSVSCLWPHAWMQGRIPITILGQQPLLMGRVPEQSMRILRLRFGDGRAIRVPTRDGFFLYQVPERVLADTAPQALLAYDAQGRLVARELLPSGVEPTFFGGLRRPPGGAELRHKHKLLTRATSVGPATIWAAPSWAAPAHCVWLQIRRAVYGGSCLRNQPARRGLSEVVPLRLPISGQMLNLLWGQAGSNVGEVSIQFQDGSETRLPIRNGVFLYPVPGSRWRIGHRPAFLTATDRTGRLLRHRLLYEYTLAR